MEPVIQNQKPSKILLICLDAVCQNFQIVKISGEFRSYSSNSQQIILCYISCAFRCILRLHQPYPRVILEEFSSLVYCHVMRAHLLYVLYLLTRKRHEILLDPEKHLSLDLSVIFAEKLKVRKQSSRHSVLYSHHSRLSLSA